MRKDTVRMTKEYDLQQQCKDLYLDLLKRCLVNWIYLEAETKPLLPRKIAYMLRMLTGGLKITIPRNVNPTIRALGCDWPDFGHTMIGLRRLDNLQFCIEDVLRKDVPGDFAETGVWRGGACIFMRGLLKAYGVSNRKVWLADSFRGMPLPNPKKYPLDKGLWFFLARGLSVSEEEVKANFSKYGLLDSGVMFLKGWFKDSLPEVPIERLAILRLDGDLYESTTDALTHLYPKLSPGGYVIVDDYGIVACQKAVEAYRKTHFVSDRIMTGEGSVTYWRKS